MGYLGQRSTVSRSFCVVQRRRLDLMRELYNSGEYTEADRDSADDATNPSVESRAAVTGQSNDPRSVCYLMFAVTNK